MEEDVLQKLPVFEQKIDSPLWAYRLPEELTVKKDQHYLSLWLNLLLVRGVLAPTHILYQQIDAFLETVLRFERFCSFLSFCLAIFH